MIENLKARAFNALGKPDVGGSRFGCWAIGNALAAIGMLSANCSSSSCSRWG
jgi:hypothetical protein